MILGAVPFESFKEIIGEELAPYRSLAAWYCWRVVDTATPG